MTPAWWYTYPSEKLWTSSVGMMTFPTNMENHKWSKRPNHQPGSMYIHVFCILFFSIWIYAHKISLIDIHLYWYCTFRPSRKCGSPALRDHSCFGRVWSCDIPHTFWAVASRSFNGLVLLGKSEPGKLWVFTIISYIGVSGFNFPIIQFCDRSSKHQLFRQMVHWRHGELSKLS